MGDTKKCKGKCGLIKGLAEFGLNKNKPDRHQNECKECRCAAQKKYAREHKEEKRKYDEEYRGANKEKISGKYKEYYLENKDELLQYQKLYYSKNKSKVLNRISSDENKEKKKVYNKNYYDKNRDSLITYSINRTKNSPQVKMANNLRRRLRGLLKNEAKLGSAIKDLGCSIDDLKKYIESLFYIRPRTNELMSWDNFGTEWHIDHIIPLSSFDLTKREYLIKACNYKNLQPMWKEHNLTKQDKILTDEQMKKLKNGETFVYYDKGSPPTTDNGVKSQRAINNKRRIKNGY